MTHREKWIKKSKKTEKIREKKQVKSSEADSRNPAICGAARLEKIILIS